MKKSIVKTCELRKKKLIYLLDKFKIFCIMRINIFFIVKET